jgi:hypothetical protein
VRSPLIVSVSMLRLPYHWVFVVGRHDDGDDDDGHDDRSRAGGLFSSAAPSFPGGRLISGKINKKMLQQRREGTKCRRGFLLPCQPHDLKEMKVW